MHAAGAPWRLGCTAGRAPGRLHSRAGAVPGKIGLEGASPPCSYCGKINHSGSDTREASPLGVTSAGAFGCSEQTWRLPSTVLEKTDLAPDAEHLGCGTVGGGGIHSTGDGSVVPGMADARPRCHAAGSSRAPLTRQPHVGTNLGFQVPSSTRAAGSRTV